MKSLSCRDVGFDCNYVAHAETNLSLFKEVQEHAFNAHGIKKEDFIPAFNEKLRSLVEEN
ncbi:MAG: DUF1059 domain-containing protein [Nitrososphaeraceae archaeon]|nr:DUF1059 domain-containing protein [Nitrososphaeraceae archaeon]